MNGIKSWKTTLTAVIGAGAAILNNVLGLEIPQDAIILVALFVIGLFAKDADKTGTEAKPRT